MIPVERINDPVLFLSGDDDGASPSAAMAEQIATRLSEASFPPGHLLRLKTTGKRSGTRSRQLGGPRAPRACRSARREALVDAPPTARLAKPGNALRERLAKGFDNQPRGAKGNHRSSTLSEV